MIKWKTSQENVKAMEDYLVHIFHLIEENLGSENGDSLAQPV